VRRHILRIPRSPTELTHDLHSRALHVRVQSVPMASHLGSTVLAETPALSVLLGRLYGRRDHAQPSARSCLFGVCSAALRAQDHPPHAFPS